MAYADPQPLTTRKLTAIVIVVLLHVVVGWAFINGLAYKVIKKVAEKTDIIDIKEAPPPPEKPPPPPPPQQKVEPPPVVAPPPIVQPPVSVAPPVVTAPRAPPVVYTAPVIAPPAPAPAPPKPTVSKAAAAKGNPASWVTNDDYPPNALRNNEAGRVSISFTINSAGRIEGCQVTSGSGFSDLDDATCRLVTRRGKYAPAVDSTGAPTPQKGSLSFRWVIPAE